MPKLHTFSLNKSIILAGEWELVNYFPKLKYFFFLSVGFQPSSLPHVSRFAEVLRYWIQAQAHCTFIYTFSRLVFALRLLSADSHIQIFHMILGDCDTKTNGTLDPRVGSNKEVPVGYCCCTRHMHTESFPKHEDEFLVFRWNRQWESCVIFSSPENMNIGINHCCLYSWFMWFLTSYYFYHSPL